MDVRKVNIIQYEVYPVLFEIPDLDRGLEVGLHVVVGREARLPDPNTLIHNHILNRSSFLLPISCALKSRRSPPHFTRLYYVVFAGRAS
jgi:hypothetical protein